MPAMVIHGQFVDVPGTVNDFDTDELMYCTCYPQTVCDSFFADVLVRMVTAVYHAKVADDPDVAYEFDYEFFVVL